jgi:predicted dehydrogenase
VRRLRVGLVAAGLVGQAEHAFFLWEERERFELAAIADASADVRAAVGDRYGIAERHATLEPLLGLGLDAIVCAAPDPIHPGIVIAALDAGLHVFCEKPLALSVELCDEMIAARDRAGRVLQVGYMKRFDPAVERLYDELPASIEDIRFISVEANDPDHEPFVDHLPMTFGRDVAPALISESRALATAQLAASAGRALDDVGERGLGSGYLSAMVHDVAVVHGLLDRLGVPLPAEADHGAVFDEGRGVQLAFGLPGGGRVSMTHLNLPGVADYTERVTAYCRDRICEVVFPSPYLRHLPTRLTVKRTDGPHGLATTEIRASYEEAFRSELRGFHAAICDGVPVRTTAEDARADVALLVSAFRRSGAGV